MPANHTGFCREGLEQQGSLNAEEVKEAREGLDPAGNGAWGEDIKWQERSNTFLPLGIQFPARQSDLGDIKRGTKRVEA